MGNGSANWPGKCSVLEALSGLCARGRLWHRPFLYVYSRADSQDHLEHISVKELGLDHVTGSKAGSQVMMPMGGVRVKFDSEARRTAEIQPRNGLKTGGSIW